MSNDSDMKSFNQAVIEEFRANDGEVGEQFEGAPMLLLLYAEQAKRMLGFATYQQNTPRIIPVVALERAPTA